MILNIYYTESSIKLFITSRKKKVKNTERAL